MKITIPVEAPELDAIIVQLAGIADFEFEGGPNVRYPALLLTFAPNTAIAEGRN